MGDQNIHLYEVCTRERQLFAMVCVLTSGSPCFLLNFEDLFSGVWNNYIF